MITLAKTIAIIALASPIVFAASVDRRTATDVHAMAKRLAIATIQGDQTVWVEALPPAMLQLSGGREAVMKATLAASDQLASLGYQITYYDPSLPTESFRYDGGVVVLVKTRIIIEGIDRKIDTNSFLVASRADEGERWYFIDGNMIPNRETMDALFPGLSDKFELPEVEHQTVMH